MIRTKTRPPIGAVKVTPNTGPPTPKRFKYFVIGALTTVGFFGLVIVVLSFVNLNMSGSIATNANSNSHPSPTPSSTLPEFPWPPRSSAYTKIPSQYLTSPDKQTLLKDVAQRLETAFRNANYNQRGYYSVPGGFALVSRLEHFKSNGLPGEEPYRWTQQIETPRIFSFDYLIALIKGKVGRYRVIVFVVSDDFFSQASGKRVDSGQAERLAIEGASALPDAVGSLHYTDNHSCTALIYEFEKTSFDKPAEFKENSTLLAETHLQKILPYLKR